MDQTREMLSPSSMDAEGDIDSSIGETSWPETDLMKTQEADVLCNSQAIDGSQASECASQATEPRLPEHPAALAASQTGATVDQAMEPEVSGASPTVPTMTSTPDQEPEPKTTQPPSSPRPVVSATEPEEAMNAQEDDTQPVVRDLGLSGESSAIEESRADHQDDQGDGHVSSTSSSERGAGTGTTSPVPHTASHSRHARIIDLPFEEPSTSIIVDTNGGQPIYVDSDEEMNMDNDKSRQTPRRRVQRARASPRSLGMVNWTSREYGTRSAASLTAAWEKVWKQWSKIHARADRPLAQILDCFHKKMSDIRKYELWNEEYRKDDGRRAHRAWVTYRIEKRVREQLQTKEVKRLVRRLGRALRRLQAAEEEHRSIAVAINNNSEDCDYIPTPTRRPQKKRSSV